MQGKGFSQLLWHGKCSIDAVCHHCLFRNYYGCILAMGYEEKGKVFEAHRKNVALGSAKGKNQRLIKVCLESTREISRADPLQS